MIVHCSKIDEKLPIAGVVASYDFERPFRRMLSSYEFSTRIMKGFSSGVFRSNAAKLAGLIAHI